MRLAAICLLLCGCASVDTVPIRWVEGNAEQIEYACLVREHKQFERVWGCARNIGGICIVYTDKSHPRQLELLGHEVKHCFKGNWH